MVSPAQEAVLQGIGIAASVVYFIVAYVLSRREVDAESRRPHNGFILWWGGLGAIGLVSAYFALGSPMGTFGLTTARVFLYGLVAILFAMLGGLSYYLLYVYTGDHRNLRRVVLFYVALMGIFVYLTESQAPFVDAEGNLAYADERAPGDLLSVAFSLGLVLPPLAAAGAYLASSGASTTARASTAS